MGAGTSRTRLDDVPPTGGIANYVARVGHNDEISFITGEEKLDLGQHWYNGRPKRWRNFAFRYGAYHLVLRGKMTRTERPA